jgi:quinol-cytochrome oxidoreductase complex cytochrome b subunit
MNMARVLRLVVVAAALLLGVTSAMAFFHRGPVATHVSFNGGGIQINRAGGCYYCGEDRWLNLWQQGGGMTVVSSTLGTLTNCHACW